MKHHARKRFGQHFLVDASVIDAIVAAIDPRPGQALVEIGPGLGAMTDPLVARCQPPDRRRTRSRPRGPPAEATGAGRGRIRRAAGRLRCALAAPRAAAAGGGQPALQHLHTDPVHLLAAVSQVQDQHFMLQKEVVERMVASPCSKAYGRLSVMLQWRYDIESVLDRAARGLRPAAARPLGRGAHAAPAGRRRRSRHRLAGRSRGRGLLSAAQAVAAHTLGRWLEERGARTSHSISSGAPRRCPSPTTLRLVAR